MSRFLIDISRLAYRRSFGRLPTGIDRVNLEYVRRYGNGARAVLTRGPFSAVLSPENSARVFEALLAPAEAGGVSIARLFAAAASGWLAPPGVAGQMLLNAGHSGLEYTGYAGSLRRRGARTVVIVHDLFPITHPEYFPAGEDARHRARMRTALTVANGIVAVSRYTLDTLQRFADAAGLRVPPAVVAPLASGLPAVEPGPRPIAQPYFVVVGTIEPRKNHLLLLNLWRRLAEQHGSGSGATAPRLVIIGQRGHENEAVVDLLERCRQIQGVVTELGRCDDAQLATYLRHAQALLFPSFAEGYGIPIAEALALGTPVIASDLAVFREVAGDVPEYAGALDGKRWMELIADYAQPGSTRRAAQLERMKVFRATTWAAHFEKVGDFLKTLDGGRRTTVG